MECISKMTRKERLLNIFNGIVPDRPAVKVWGANPFQECNIPAFEPVRRLAIDKTDLVVSTGSEFNLYCGCHSQQYIETHDIPTDSDDWVDRVTIYHTPAGDLRSVFTKSTCGKPGYEKEYLLKEPDDIKKLLSMPYDEYDFSIDAHRKTENELGNAGIAMFCLDHAMYGLVRLIGSESFALWSFDYEELMLEAIEIFSTRLCEFAKTAISNGISGIFGWVGPELCIPPLMSPTAFDTYVFGFDKRIINIIHNGGGRVWVHCHGKMKTMISRFVEMGVDVLNPIEPPPMGDISMEDAFKIVGSRMALEGNIETHDFMVCTPHQLEKKIHDTLDAGRGKRLILCPSSGYMESVEPSAQEIENWFFYINESVQFAEEISKI